MKVLGLRVLLLAVAGLLVSVSTQAQNTVNGTITGVVTDNSGAVVVDANVTATNVSTQIAQTRTTNTTGLYLFADLAPAQYDVKISKDGFRTCESKGVTLDPGLTRTISCVLQIGSTTESVTVEAGSLQVDTTTSKINEVINAQQIEELPVNGRSMANFLALEPGVAGINFGDFNSMNIFATQGVSVNGLRDQDNNILVDGVSSQRTSRQRRDDGSASDRCDR